MCLAFCGAALLPASDSRNLGLTHLYMTTGIQAWNSPHDTYLCSISCNKIDGVSQNLNHALLCSCSSPPLRVGGHTGMA